MAFGASLKVPGTIEGKGYMGLPVVDAAGRPRESEAAPGYHA